MHRIKIARGKTFYHILSELRLDEVTLEIGMGASARTREQAGALLRREAEIWRCLPSWTLLDSVRSR
jgi:hypothetical protein